MERHTSETPYHSWAITRDVKGSKIEVVGALYFCFSFSTVKLLIDRLLLGALNSTQ